MSLVTKEIWANASYIYHGDEICQEKSKLLLKEMGLPNGLLTLEDIEEFGYVKDTGFLWLRQKKPNKAKNEKIGALASNAVEVTAFVEKFKIKKLKGVKAREFMMWIPISEVSVDNPLTGKITFKSSTGIPISFPVSAFENDDVKKDVGGGVAKHAKVKEALDPLSVEACEYASGFSPSSLDVRPDMSAILSTLIVDRATEKTTESSGLSYKLLNVKPQPTTKIE